MKDEIELDEAYFGGHRKGRRGRGAAGKSVVFGLLERDGRIYAKVAPASDVRRNYLTEEAGAPGGSIPIGSVENTILSMYSLVS